MARNTITVRRGSDAWLAIAAAAVALSHACSAEPAGKAGGFATDVVSYSPSASGGFGSDDLPQVVLGPPLGGGELSGGTDVLSLGCGGSIVLLLGGDGAVDGPGPDLIVFENAFRVSGGDGLFMEPGEVSVSEDGVTWLTFDCVIREGEPPTGCAGLTPVLSSPDNGIDPTDPAQAGGDSFDLSEVGLERARYVRILDMTGEWLGSGLQCTYPTGGFDLDSVAVAGGPG